jgi:hypothetical protein
LLSLVVPGSAPAGARTAEGAIAGALDYAMANAADLGVTRHDLGDLVATDAYTTPDAGVTHVYLQQRHDGVPIDGAMMTATIAKDGDVAYADAAFVRDIAAKATGTAALSGDAAVTRARRVTGVRVGRAAPAVLTYERRDGDRLRLAWVVLLEEPLHLWRVAVDAQDGAVLSVADLARHERAPGQAKKPRPRTPSKRRALAAAADAKGSYRVYGWPTISPEDGARSLVTEPADSQASPFGWHDTNGALGPDHTVTRGNNAHAFTNTLTPAEFALGPLSDPETGYQPDPMGEPDGGENLLFDFEVDFSKPPAVSKEAAVTNAFYWANVAHDVFYRYGFDEPAGNFQANNYGRPGLARDQMQLKVQALYANNAVYSGGADGASASISLEVWTPTSPAAVNGGATQVRDSAFDTDIILHEYAHGVSDRLTGGPSATGCVNNAESPSEGWSDFLAMALTAREGEKGADARGVGTYVMFDTPRTGKGVRQYPYSTSLAVDPAMYDDLKTPGPSIPQSSQAETHDVGVVWASMLWDVYWELVDAHGFNPDVTGHWSTGGNNLAIQLVIDGLKLQVCHPGFVDSRDAILAADRVRTGGANQCAIWRGFAKRGLGAGAQQGSSASTLDGTQSFAIPASCQ